MKSIIVILSILMLTACTTRTEFGACVGIMDNKNPTLRYDVSYWNGFIALLLSETVIVPLYTVAKDIQCPVGPQ